MTKATNAIYAKMLCRYGTRLREKNYKDLVMQSSVQNITAYLKSNTRYKQVLKDLGDETVDRATIELFLYKDLFDQIGEICSFDRSIGDVFFEILVLENEIEELMSYLRYYNAKNSESYMFYLPNYFKAHNSINLIGLSQAKTYDEVIACVKRADFLTILKKHAPEQSGQYAPVDYSRIGAAFDNYYFDYVVKFVKKNFSGVEQKQLLTIYKLECEINNIRRIYRAKRFFDVKPEELRELVVPIRCYLPKNMLESLINAADEREVIALLKQTTYMRMFEQVEFKNIDDFTNSVLYNKYGKLIHNSFSASVVMCTIFKLFEFEIKDLTNIIEGVRYKLDPHQIQNLLVVKLNT